MIALLVAHVLTNAHLAQFQKATNTQSTQTYVLIAVPVQTSAHQALSPQANNLPPTENPIASPSTMMRMQFFLAPNPKPPDAISSLLFSTTALMSSSRLPVPSDKQQVPYKKAKGNKK